MRTFISNADRTDSPEYDYRLDPLHPRNRRAAKLLGWSFDPDFRDYVDDKGFRLGGGFHTPVNNTADTTR